MKSFFNLSEGLDPMSPQALGRKREMMMRALSLDDAEFERWVHDRIIRHAERNGIPLQQLDVGSLKKGFAEWQQHFQQNDRNFDQYKTQVSQYISKFMSVVPGILAKFQSGQDAPVAEPMSPTMAKYEAGPKKSKDQIEREAQQPAEPQYAQMDAPYTPEQTQEIQRGAMNIVDLVTNSVTNMGEDESRINKAQFKKIVRDLADQIAQANQVDTSQLNYDMIDDYIQSIRDVLETTAQQDDLGFDENDLNTWENLLKQELIDQYGIAEPQEEKEMRAEQQLQQQLLQAAIDPNTVKGIRGEDMELGIVAALEQVMQQSHLTDVARNKINSKLTDEQKKYFELQAQAMLQKYPFLKGARIKHVGRKSGKLTPTWKSYNDSGATKTIKPDVSADLAIALSDDNFVRFDPEKNTFVRCSMKEIQEAPTTGCTNQLMFSVKKGETQLMSARQAETTATFNTALTNLSQLGHDFTNPQKLAEHFMNTYGLDEVAAEERAQSTVASIENIKTLTQKFIIGLTAKGQVNAYKAGGAYRNSEDPSVRKSQEIIDQGQEFVDSMNKEMSNLVQSMPEVVAEMAYIAASGEGKFEPPDIASHFLSFSETDPKMGPKIIPITRNLMYNLVANGGVKVFSAFKSDSVKKIKKKLKQDFKTQGAEAGLQGQELDKYVRENLDNEVPYSFSTVLRMTMDELPDTPMKESRSFFNFKMRNLLEASNEDLYNNTQGISDTTKKYTKEALKWAFTNMENLTKFFEMKPEIGDVKLPDFNDDTQEAYFKKEMKDELRDLDML